MSEKDCNTMHRRQFLRTTACGLLSLPMLSQISCTAKEPPLRIASNVWPGYELLYMARELKYFSEPEIRLVEVPSATVCIKSLAAGSVEGAMLTLDEVLTARADGLDLKIIAVLDVSLGADVIVAREDIHSLNELKGKRIGVEQSAVGAVMLDAALRNAGLKPSDVIPVYLTVNKHLEAFEQHKVDAVVSFEPVRSKLLSIGAKQLFSSAEIPGRIIDVLAVLPTAIERSPNTIANLVDGHFKALKFFKNNQEVASRTLAKRMNMLPAEVPSSYEGLELPDVIANEGYLKGASPLLEMAITDLARIMQQANLLPSDVILDNIINPNFLPRS